MNEALFELEKEIEKLDDDAKSVLRLSLARVRNHASDMTTKLENYEEENEQLRAKNTELWRDLLALRREAEQGFDYYPGPSSHCLMCEVPLVVMKDGETEEQAKDRVAHGLCDECKPQYDQLHPGARLKPEDKKPHLESV